jgi:hypothetical protein
MLPSWKGIKKVFKLCEKGDDALHFTFFLVYMQVPCWNVDQLHNLPVFFNSFTGNILIQVLSHYIITGKIHDERTNGHNHVIE